MGEYRSLLEDMIAALNNRAARLEARVETLEAAAPEPTHEIMVTREILPGLSMPVAVPVAGLHPAAPSGREPEPPCPKCGDRGGHFQCDRCNCPIHPFTQCDGRVLDFAGPGGCARWVHDAAAPAKPEEPREFYACGCGWTASRDLALVEAALEEAAKEAEQIAERRSNRAGENIYMDGYCDAARWLANYIRNTISRRAIIAKVGRP